MTQPHREPKTSGNGEYALVHVDTGRQIGVVRMLESWWSKGVGVIGMPALPPRTGIVLPGVASIHMLFVRFPLDILFVDKSCRLLNARRGVPPWTPLVHCRGAYYTVELPAGTLDDERLLAVGGQWRLENVSAASLQWGGRE